MHLIWLTFFIAGCLGNLKVSIDEKGGYRLIVNGNDWLRSSRTALYAHDQWFSSHDGSLSLVAVNEAEGVDPNLGTWNETNLTYGYIYQGVTANVTGRIRQWWNVPAITFHLETGTKLLMNKKTLDVSRVRTVFPSFHIEKMDSNDERAYFTFAGIMTGDGRKHAGIWNHTSIVVPFGIESGPIVIFNQTQHGEGDLLVLSPLSEFMATSIVQTNESLEYGVMGSMSSIIPNYSHSLIVFYSPNGINKGVREWGQVMRKAYNRTTEHRLNDLSINMLGYYTDNGAYYYYKTEAGVNYEQTILDVMHNITLPFHYLQIDSWWYYKGIKEGVSEWVARPDIFPDGLPAVYHKLNNIPIVAHNRYWAYDTVYKKNYSFIFDEKHQMALPVGNDSFWIDLFTKAKEWGLIVYEQDWLITQIEEFTPMETDITLGYQWLLSMGEAAEKLNINIQYCMSLPRHILTALKIPRVTQTRVSTDYAVHIMGKADQWAIGISSMFADAIGLAPFKDVFWSSSIQPGANYTPSPKEVLPEREMAIATLSTGPVAPGDAINYTKGDLIMKCCRKDGVILKPDRPITTINAMISEWALHESVSQGELYSTKTTIDNQTFHVIFASSMKQTYQVTPSMIASQSGVVWSTNTPTIVTAFNISNPVTVSANTCDNLTLCLWYVSPLWQFNDASKTTYALIGETDKWTAISHQRIVSIKPDAQGTSTLITLVGAPDEQVTMSVFISGKPLQTVTCTISITTRLAQLIITPDSTTCS